MKLVTIIYLLTIAFPCIVLAQHDKSVEVKYVETKDGKDYYFVRVGMNVRKTYNDLQYDPYPNKLSNSDLTRRRVLILLHEQAEIISLNMYDTYEGKRAQYKKDPANNGLLNPSGWEAAIWSLTKEQRDRKDYQILDVFLANWKHNWNRFNDLEVVYAVPEFRRKDRIAIVHDSGQIEAKVDYPFVINYSIDWDDVFPTFSNDVWKK